MEEWLKEGDAHLHKRVRRAILDANDEVTGFADGTVTGFLPAELSDFTSEFTGQPAALWHITYDASDMGEEDLEEVEVDDAIEAFTSKAWSDADSLRQASEHRRQLLQDASSPSAAESESEVLSPDSDDDSDEDYGRRGARATGRRERKKRAKSRVRGSGTRRTGGQTQSVAGNDVNPGKIPAETDSGAVERSEGSRCERPEALGASVSAAGAFVIGAARCHAAARLEAFAPRIAPSVLGRISALMDIGARMAERAQGERWVPALPNGWSRARDSASGKIYYYNKSTGAVQWAPPLTAAEGLGTALQVDTAAVQSTANTLMAAGAQGGEEAAPAPSAGQTGPICANANTDRPVLDRVPEDKSTPAPSSLSMRGRCKQCKDQNRSARLCRAPRTEFVYGMQRGLGHTACEWREEARCTEAPHTPQDIPSLSVIMNKTSRSSTDIQERRTVQPPKVRACVLVCTLFLPRPCASS